MSYPEITPAAQDAYGKNFRLERAEATAPADENRNRPREAGDTEVAAAKNAAARDDARSQALLKVVEPIEQLMGSVGVDISFRIDEATKQIQAEVRTGDGERVIRKVPSDEILKLAASIRELTKSFENFVDKTL